MNECGEQRSILAMDCRDRDLDREFVTFPVQGRQFEPLAQHFALSGFQVPLQSGCVYVAIPFGHDHLGQCRTDCLIGLPAECLFRLRIPVQDHSIRVHADEGIERRVDDHPAGPFASAKCLNGVHFLSDVARDTEGADDLPGFVAQGQFAGRNPGRPSVRPGFFFLLADHRLAGLHQFDFVLTGLGRVLFCKEVCVGQTIRRRRIVQAKPLGHRPADSQKPAVTILEVNMIGQMFHQGMQQ